MPRRGTSWPWGSKKPEGGTRLMRHGTGRSPSIRDASMPWRSSRSTIGGGAPTTAQPCGRTAPLRQTHCTGSGASSSVTRDAGRYLVQGLAVGGPYAIVIRRIGFATETRDNVFLSLGQDLRMDVRLRPEAAVLPPVVVPGNVDPAFSPSHTGVAMVVSDSA